MKADREVHRLSARIRDVVCHSQTIVLQGEIRFQQKVKRIDFLCLRTRSNLKRRMRGVGSHSLPVCLTNDGEFSSKEGIMSLEAQQTFETRYRIEII